MNTSEREAVATRLGWSIWRKGSMIRAYVPQAQATDMALATEPGCSQTRARKIADRVGKCYWDLTTSKITSPAGDKTDAVGDAMVAMIRATRIELGIS